MTTRQSAIIAFGLSIFFLIAGFYKDTFPIIWLIGAVSGWWLVGIALLARAEREKRKP